MAASKMLIPSLTHFRPLTCAASAAAASYPARLVPHPPDLVKWVKREGGLRSYRASRPHSFEVSVRQSRWGC
ncbi:hypothetical protein COLO4_02853 [Corchorus olitorius]|uniref:Uncharacterized protein n=1 Tax=Corchorus olitorius TaxID=93759 RepID=A0A1R3L025_9ROSI|nr:hypothetical protein COLO4_02853 [Corchorus olitorius]